MADYGEYYKDFQNPNPTITCKDCKSYREALHEERENAKREHINYADSQRIVGKKNEEIQALRTQVALLVKQVGDSSKELAAIGKVEESLRKELEKLKNENRLLSSALQVEKSRTPETVIHNHNHYHYETKTAQPLAPFRPYEPVKPVWYGGTINANGNQ